MSDLREAARRALEGLEDRGDVGAVTRMTIDVAVDGRSELVTIAIRDGQLTWTTTGDARGPHVQAALRWLATDAEAGGSSTSPERGAEIRRGARTDGGGATARRSAVPASGGSAGPSIAEPEVQAARVSWEPGEPEGESTDATAPTARARLADALEDVVTVVVRAGSGAPDSPSVAESLERLRREAPLPTPTGLARWLGRLRAALEGKDALLVARLLDGAARLAEDLRVERPTSAVRRRVVGWMGTSGEGGAVERLSDRLLLEVSREWLASSERGGVERRYLVDLHDGEVFREERAKTTPVASVGPCPRLVTVGLAEVENSAAPRRIRLMQYVVSLEPSRDDFARVGASAYRRFGDLAERYRTWVADHPGQAEPFAIVAPREWRDEDGPVGYDDEGDALPCARADDPAAVDLLRRLVPASGPRWIAGRLVDVDGALMIVPCAVAVPEGDDTRLHRLR